jgi:hypothetical protein
MREFSFTCCNSCTISKQQTKTPKNHITQQIRMLIGHLILQYQQLRAHTFQAPTGNIYMPTEENSYNSDQMCITVRKMYNYSDTLWRKEVRIALNTNEYTFKENTNPFHLLHL